MSNAPRATMMKRQRELDQKDRAKAREMRRVDRRARSAERAASGEVGPPMGEAPPPLGEYDPTASAQFAPAGESPAQTAKRGPQKGSRLYVGNLSYDVSEDALRELFAEFGEVTDIHIAMDRDSGRPRGFAFVTMGSRAEAESAMSSTNGSVLDGRSLRVNPAEDRPRGSF